MSSSYAAIRLSAMGGLSNSSENVLTPFTALAGVGGWFHHERCSPASDSADSAHEAGVFTDKASGKDVARPQLEALLRFVRDGDTVIVHSLDRLARNLDDLRRFVQGLTARGVRVQFVKEQLTFTGEDAPMANLLLSVIGAFAEFERALIRERQREGIALAKQRGAYRGRKRSLTPVQVAELTERAATGETKSALAREFGVSRETVYQYLRATPTAGKGPGGHHTGAVAASLRVSRLVMSRFTSP